MCEFKFQITAQIAQRSCIYISFTHISTSVYTYIYIDKLFKTIFYSRKIVVDSCWMSLARPLKGKSYPQRGKHFKLELNFCCNFIAHTHIQTRTHTVDLRTYRKWLWVQAAVAPPAFKSRTRYGTAGNATDHFGCTWPSFGWRKQKRRQFN